MKQGAGQRRRFVHSLRPVTGKDGFCFTMEFETERLATGGEEALVLGLFDSARPVGASDLGLCVGAAGESHLLVVGAEETMGSLIPTAQLESGRPYHLTFTAAVGKHASAS